MKRPRPSADWMDLYDVESWLRDHDRSIFWLSLWAVCVAVCVNLALAVAAVAWLLGAL